ncbi:MAG TPA: hypothetical protein GXX28_12135 [Firmicutes bacterium]|nr:hypothetical protein [Bacillota bacterium]
MTFRRAAAFLSAVVFLGGAFLAGFLAMARDVRLPQWMADRAGSGVSLAAAVGREAPGPAVLPGRRPARAYVVLPAVLPAHPDWPRLAQLTAEVEREQRLLAAEQTAEDAISRTAGGDSSAGRPGRVSRSVASIAEAHRSGREETAAAFQAAYARRWEAERTRIRKQAEEKVAARRAILAAQADERLGVKRGELKADLETRLDRIRREKEARLLSLQLQLGLLPKDPGSADRAAALQSELRQVQESIEQETEAARRQTEEQLAAYAQEIQAQAERDLQAYAAEVQAAAGREAEAVRRQLDEELASRLAALEGLATDRGPAGPAAGLLPSSGSSGGAGSGKGPGAVREAPTRLQLQRNALQARITADVQRLAALVARQRGCATPLLVASTAERPVGAVDLTQDVVHALAR